MASASPSTPSAPSGRTISQVMSACLSESFALLSRTGSATEPELIQTRQAMEQAASGTGQPGDIIETLVRIQGTADDLISEEGTRIAQQIALASYPVLPVIPFSAKLITPTAFYEAFPQVLSLARLLMAPVIYAEDTDAIGVGALNPVAAKVMSEEIISIVDLRMKVKPFVTAVRMDFNSWAFLTRKQFSL